MRNQEKAFELQVLLKQQHLWQTFDGTAEERAHIERAQARVLELKQDLGVDDEDAFLQSMGG